jgi:hypothetical protein
MRYPDWQARFQIEVAAAQVRSFAWMEHDCCAFVARMIDAISDTDHYDRLRQLFQYYSEAEMLECVARYGGLRQLVSQEFLGEAGPWGSTRMGDAVLLRDDEDREVVGICEGAQALVATDRGLVPFPMSRALCAWRVN